MTFFIIVHVTPNCQIDTSVFIHISFFYQLAIWF